MISRPLRAFALVVPLAVSVSAACSDGASDVVATPSSGGTAGRAGLAGGGGAATAGSAGKAGSVTGGSAGAAGSSAGAAGSSAGAAGSSGAAGASIGGSGGAASAGAAGTTGQVACESVNDCVGTVPLTQPPGCAVATCDPATKLCKLVAKDFDGDGHGTTSCKTAATVTITLGDDCNDTDPQVFPGAWDGPAGTEGGVPRPDSCNDGVDNDCSGTPGDGKLSDGTTCKCTPGDVRACSQDDGGKPVNFPGGSPKGECRRGSQTCVANGSWGPCTGTVKPTDEICDKKDNDCDGAIDEEDALNRKVWRWDHDGDGHSDPKIAEIVACDQPLLPPANCVPSATTICTLEPETWRTGATPDDCHDDDTTANPAEKEVCDGVDNDCDGQIDEGANDPIDWFFDADGDGFITTNASARKVEPSCGNPGLLEKNCPPGKTSCPELWAKQGAAPLTDCDDTDAEVHPGAWDGPAFPSRPYGLEPPGLALELFALTPKGPPPDLATATKIPTTRVHVQVNFDLGKGGLEPGTPTDLAARWSGAVSAPEDGEYTFTTLSDEGTRLNIDGTSVIDDWNVHGLATKTGKVTLQKGKVVPLRLEWFDNDGAATIVLQWSGPGVPLQPLTVRLDPAGGAKPDRCAGGKDWDCSGTPADAHIRTPGESVLDDTCGGCDPLGIDPAQRLSKACGDTQEAFACHPGAQHCLPDGKYGECVGEAPAKPETCDGADNNCNGTVDDGFGIGTPCNNGTGSCRRSGTLQCTGAQATACDAVPGQPTSVCTPSAVNGSFDANCDGTDEVCTTSDVRSHLCGASAVARDNQCDSDALAGPNAPGTQGFRSRCEGQKYVFACAAGCGKEILTFDCQVRAFTSGAIRCISNTTTSSTSTCK